jgi:DNA-binding transcriptional LysR family regulator
MSKKSPINVAPIPELKGMKIKHLDLFNAVVENQTLRKASEILQITQPAATKLIQELESILGAQLFTRDRKGMWLTQYGEILKRHTSTLMADLAEMYREITQLQKGEIGQIRLGFVPSLDPELLSKAISNALTKFPEIQIRTFEGSTNELMASMGRNELDLILGRILNVKIANQYAMYPIYKESFAIVCGAKSLHKNKANINWEQLSKGQWILPALQTPFREMIDNLFTQHGVLRPNVVVESSSFEKIQKLIINTELLGILPTSLAIQGQKNNTLKLLKSNLGKNFAPISLIYRKDIEISPVTQKFVDLISSLHMNHSDMN